MEVLGWLIALVVAGFAPMLLYSAVMWWLDRYEKEPWWLLVLVFAWGAVPAVILAAIAQLFGILSLALIADRFDADDSLLMLTVIAPLTEEFTKGLALLFVFLVFRRHLDSLVDGVVYGSLVGFGFAATENVLYFGGALLEHGVAAFVVVLVFRSVIFGLGHAFFTSLTGLGFALARHGRSPSTRVLGPIAGLAGAMLFHGLHNLGAGLAAQHLGWLGFTFATDWLGVAGVFVVILVALARERRWILTELTEEVESGLLSAAERQTLGSSFRRSANLLGTLFRRGPSACWSQAQFYQTATRLAFQKRHLRELGDDATVAREVIRLREDLAKMPHWH